MTPFSVQLPYLVLYPHRIFRREESLKTFWGLSSLTSSSSPRDGSIETIDVRLAVDSFDSDLFGIGGVCGVI